MTNHCPAARRDRFNTVHRCSLEPEHGGYHETVDGLLFADPGIDHGLRARKYPVQAVRYAGDTTAGIRELAEIVRISGDVTWAPLTVKVGPTFADIYTLYPGEWLVQFSDGSVEHYEADRYHEAFATRKVEARTGVSAEPK